MFNAPNGASMETATHHSSAAREGVTGPVFVSLDRETRAAVDTATAAYHLSRQPQTLRCWATYGSGPITPFRISGRLAWKTADLRKLLGVK